MGKRETKDTYKDVRSDKVATGTDYDLAGGASTGRVDALGAPIRTQGEDLAAKYNNMQTLGPAPVVQNAGMIDTGNLDQNRQRFQTFSDEAGGFNAAKPSIMEGINRLKAIGASETGGLTSENINRIRGNGGFEALQNNGGLDAAAMQRMRGGGGYEQLAATGGYTPENIANIKAQALSPIGSFATGTRDELARRTAQQGGYAPGFDAANRALQRDTARNIADTSLNANVAIQDRINAGKLSGMAGMAGTEANLQGLRTGNMLNATQGMSQAESGMTQQIMGNRMGADINAANLETNLQDRIAQYRLQGLSGEQAAARAMADVQGQNIGNANNMNMFNANNQMDVNRTNLNQANIGIGGLQDLYNTNVGREQNELNRGVDILNSGTNANLGYLNNQSGLATQPGIGGNVMKGIGTAAGVAAALYTGGGSVLASRLKR